LRLERDEERARECRENRGTKKSREAVPKRRTSRYKGIGLSHGYPETRKKKIMAMRRPKRVEAGRTE